MEELFREWLSTQLQTAGAVSSYLRALNGNDLEYADFRLQNGLEQNVFDEQNIGTLDSFYQRLVRGGDLAGWNAEHDNRRLSAALRQYLDFYQYYKATQNVGSLNDKKALNKILYGPPGTGKTFSTVDLAMSILESSSPTTRPGSIQELKEAYPGQVEFVTFHQSFSYEDFVEGIQATTEDGGLSYDVVGGVFKKICDAATKKEYQVNDLYESVDDDKTVWKVSLGGARDHPLKKDCFENSIIRIGWPNVLASNERDQDFNKLSPKTQNTLLAFEEEMQIGDVIASLYDAKSIDAIGIVTGDFERDEHDDYPRKRSVNWLWVKGVNEKPINIKSINSVNMVQQTVYRLNRLKPSGVFALLPQDDRKIRIESDASTKKHVLIIDEINRGNISRIFGELITLIEPSKRAGNPEAIEVTLPYSKTSFSVPNNLYIIGTMNTADRSLALMDTALRRRFDFIEMLPNPCLLHNDLSSFNFSAKDWEKLDNWNFNKNDTSDWSWHKDYEEKDVLIDGVVNLRRLLFTMNQRIEALYDREHTLGHAFLMNLTSLDDLRQAFKNKILPLLEEYFYDDWQKIRWVLGDAADSFYQKQTFSNLFTDSDAPNDTEKFLRKTFDNLNAEQFQMIYQGV